MISHNQLIQDRNEKIERLTRAADQAQANLESTSLKLGSTELELTKVADQLATARKDLVETAEKLTTTHKHSHEVEVKLGQEIEKSATLAEELGFKEK